MACQWSRWGRLQAHGSRKRQKQVGCKMQVHLATSARKNWWEKPSIGKFLTFRWTVAIPNPKSTCTRWLIPLFWNLQMLVTALLGRPAGFLPRTHNSTRCRIEYRQGVHVRQTKHTQVRTRSVPTGKDNRACKELQPNPGGYNI